MKIGDLVRYHGRLFWLRGFTPASLPPQRVELEDVRTGEWSAVPAADVKPTTTDGPVSLRRD